MKIRRLLAIGLTLFVLLAAVVPASAAAEPVVSNEWIDLSGGTWNSCTDEWVELSGRVHYVYSVVYHENGDSTFQEHMNADVTGVGMTTGARYLFPTVSNEHSTAAFDYAPYVYTKVYRYQGITSGPGNNDIYWQLVHFTVNVDGTVTSEVDDSGWECR